MSVLLSQIAQGTSLELNTLLTSFVFFFSFIVSIHLASVANLALLSSSSLRVYFSPPMALVPYFPLAKLSLAL